MFFKSNEIINFNSNQNETCERHTLVMISLPGLNEWVHQVDKENHKDEPETCNITQNQSQKRSIEDEEPMETENSNGGETNECKKVCVSENKKESTAVVSREHILNFPLPNREGRCCHVKVCFIFKLIFKKILTCIGIDLRKL